MQCTHRSLFKTPKGYIKIPCGKCLACAANKRKDYAMRCQLECSSSGGASFITLTYSDENYIDCPRKASHELTLFFRRLKKRVSNLRYLGVTEEGDNTHRLHHHAIVWPILDEIIVKELWTAGHIQCVLSNTKTINYVAGYSVKKLGNENFGRLLMSSPAPGRTYLLDNYDVIYSQLIDTGRFLFNGAYHAATRYIMRLYGIEAGEIKPRTEDEARKEYIKNFCGMNEKQKLTFLKSGAISVSRAKDRARHLENVLSERKRNLVF